MSPLLSLLIVFMVWGYVIGKRRNHPWLGVLLAPFVAIGGYVAVIFVTASLAA